MIAIVHHGGCPDGVAAAWVAWSAHRATSTKEIQVIPASYGMPLPEWGDPGPDLIYVLDFSWPYEQMVELAKRCEKLIVLDHHQTAIDNISEGLNWGPPEAGSNVLPSDAPFAGVLDSSRSGAMITWDYFYLPERHPPPLIEYVQDRDLWRWELPRSREVGSLILTMGETVQEVDRFMRLSPSALLLEASGAYAFEQAAVRSALKSARWCVMTAPDGERREFPIFPSPYILGSTGCEQLMEIAGCDMAGYYIERSDGTTQYGFRSRNGVTVHDWAQKFGGGGHPPAAGCTIDWLGRELLDTSSIYLSTPVEGV